MSTHKTDEFEALVVGSGLTGGIAAYALTNLGLRTLVLEAGPSLKGGKDIYGTTVGNLFRQLKERWWTGNKNIQRGHPSFGSINPDLFIDDQANPYSTPDGKPFYWIRGRQVGGRSHMWDGTCLRFSNYELKANALDGRGTPWPLSYEDIAPYYDRIEKLLEVHGDRDGLSNLPDGQFSTPSKLTDAERHFQRAIKASFGRDVVCMRGIRAARTTQPGEKFSRLSSNQTSLDRALQTGHLTLRSDAIVAQLTKDHGRVSGVDYIDTRTRERRHVEAKLIILSASTIETVRLLWNSQIGNSSGLLGKGIADHIAKIIGFLLPDFAEEVSFDFPGSDGVVISRYMNLFDNKSSRATDFSRGYGFFGGISRFVGMPKKRIYRGHAAGFLIGMGEPVPVDSNRITIDSRRTDAWGIPIAHIECQWHKEDLALGSKMIQDAHDMVRAAGGNPGELGDLLPALPAFFVGKFMRRAINLQKEGPPGLFVHEVGGARMGNESDKSVTNSFGQLWDSPNVILGDGSVFPSAGWQNPSLTMMALCLRAVEAAGEKLKRGVL